MKDDNNKTLPPAFRALADPTRLRILLMLEGKPRTVNEIVEFFDLSQPTISRHLQTLAAADLVIRSQHGREVTYQINPERIGNVCISLAACFPCCCVTVTPTEQQTAANKCDIEVDTRSGQKRTKKVTKRKGDTL